MTQKEMALEFFNGILRDEGRKSCNIGPREMIKAIEESHEPFKISVFCSCGYQCATGCDLAMKEKVIEVKHGE